MTERIDHVAEANILLDSVSHLKGQHLEADMALLQAHTTLALVEQARVANLIALGSNAARQVAEGTTTLADYLRVYNKINPEIKLGLGVEDE